MSLPFILNLPFAQAVFVVAAFMMCVNATKPLKLLWVYIVFRPLLQPAATQGFVMYSIHIGSGLPILLIIFTALNVLRLKHKVFISDINPLYLYLLLSLPSLVVTPSIPEGIAQCLKVISSLCAFILVYNNIRSEDDILYLLKGFILSSVIPVIFGFYQYVTKTGHMYASEHYAGTRIDSVLMSWNVYGEYLSIMICLLVMRYSNKKWPKPGLALHAISGGIVLSFLFALNRGSWIALTIALVGGLILYRGAIKVRWLIIGAIVVALFAGKTIVERFDELESVNFKGEKRDTFQGRVNGWVSALELLAKKSALTGLGIGASQDITLTEFGVSYSPHNDYVRVLFECGPLAFLFYIVFILRTMAVHVRLSKIEHKKTINYAIFVMSIYYTVISFTQNIITNATILPMLLVCFAFASSTMNMPAPNDNLEAQGESDEEDM